MLNYTVKSLFSANCECQESEPKPDRKKKALIVGAGLVGINSAYYLAKDGGYDITVIDKEFPITGASQMNGCSITMVPYPAFTSMNIWGFIKENITNWKNPTPYLKFTLIFESQFRLWARKFWQNTAKDKIDHSNKSILKINSLGCKEWRKLAREVTDNTKDFDYTESPIISIMKNPSEASVKGRENIYSILHQYDDKCGRIENKDLDPYVKRQRFNSTFSDKDVFFILTTQMINPAKYCAFMKSKLENEFGVKFIQGKVEKIIAKNKHIDCVDCISSESQTHKLSDFDCYIFCGGIGSIDLANMLGLSLPMYGILGHAMNMYPSDKDMLLTTMNYVDNHVFMSAVGGQTDNLVRVTGFGDIIGNTLTPLPQRRQALIDFSKEVFGEANYSDDRASHWVGLRPVTADDLPIIGKSSQYSNLYWNTGHGSRGVTQSSASALILSYLLNPTSPAPDVPISDYCPSRFNI